MVGVDQRDGTRFDLSHLATPLSPDELPLGDVLWSSQTSWRWQRAFAELVVSEPRLIIGKGRQIGATWVVLAVDVAEAITMPGTTSLLYRQREDEAIDNLRRWWVLYQSLPAWVREGHQVLRPAKGALPGEGGIILRLPGSEVPSEVIPMSSAASSGHGRSVRRIVLDEAAYIEKLAEIGAAVEPAAGRAKIDVISTANGRSNPETGEGNEFHRRWEDEGSGYRRVFLAYDVHPDRDEHWYATAPEVRSLRPHQRNEQFPRNPHEAFRLTANTWFDPDDLDAYAQLVEPVKYRARLDLVERHLGVWKHDPTGRLRVLREPEPNGAYAIGADVATGYGGDYSCAYVVDLSSMALVAEYHGRLGQDVFARDLHFLGRWFNTALIAVETGGGYGDAVIVALRDGKSGRPPYPKLYRHVLSTRPDLAEAKPFGFPMTSKTRPLVLNGLERAVRDRSLPWVTDGLLYELGNFVAEPAPGARGSSRGPWPRAADGLHDDRVLAAAITLELFRLRGEHRPPVRRPKRRHGVLEGRVSPYPWVRTKSRV